MLIHSLCLAALLGHSSSFLARFLPVSLPLSFWLFVLLGRIDLTKSIFPSVCGFHEFARSSEHGTGYLFKYLLLPAAAVASKLNTDFSFTANYTLYFDFVCEHAFHKNRLVVLQISFVVIFFKQYFVLKAHSSLITKTKYMGKYVLRV